MKVYFTRQKFCVDRTEVNSIDLSNADTKHKTTIH